MADFGQLDLSGGLAVIRIITADQYDTCRPLLRQMFRLRYRVFKERMGWSFDWVSSLGSDFNYDFDVSFSKEAREDGTIRYNYRASEFPADEAPGASVFYKDDSGKIYHTYSCYARGLDILNGAYNYLDLVPKGRDEDDLPYGMAWLRRRDQYED